MRTSLRVAAVALTAALQSAPAFAQAFPCSVCRAQIPFGSCDSAAIANPPKGSIGVVGTVAGVEATHCDNAGLPVVHLTVDVKRSSSSLPVRTRIDVRPCLLWVGKTGDNISAMVLDTPSESGAYQARMCN